MKLKAKKEEEASAPKPWIARFKEYFRSEEHGEADSRAEGQTRVLKEKLAELRDWYFEGATGSEFALASRYYWLTRAIILANPKPLELCDIALNNIRGVTKGNRKWWEKLA